MTIFFIINFKIKREHGLTGVTEATAALIVVSQLDAVEAAGFVARVWAALVNVTFTALAGKTGRTHTLVLTNTVDAVTAIQTGRAKLRGTLVDIHLTLMT